jgi:hypothetical protein
VAHPVTPAARGIGVPTKSGLYGEASPTDRIGCTGNRSALPMTIANLPTPHEPPRTEQAFGAPPAQAGEPPWLRNPCAASGADLESKVDYIPPRGYLLYWRCAAGCGYRRVI